jgi:uncharacterized protein YjbI with pentapeptide repeats
MQDYDPDALTETELAMMAQLHAGHIADLGGGNVRADVLARCILKICDEDGRSRALKVRRGTIAGVLDFEGAEVGHPLSFTSVTFQGERNRGAIILRDAQFRRLTLQNCDIEGAVIVDRATISGGMLVGGGRINGAVYLRGAACRGAISIGGTKLGDGTNAIAANGLESIGPVAIKDVKCFGLVSLDRSRLSAGLNGEKLVVKLDEAALAQGGPALSLVGSRIEGDFGLDRARFDHALHLDNIRISGSVSWVGMDVKRGGVLANAIAVAQGLELDDARIGGTLLIDGAEIGRRVSGERLDIDGGDVAISARVARIGGDVSLPRLRAIGEVWFPGAHIAGQLRMSECMLYGADLAIRADGLQADGGWFMSRATIVGLVRLPAARLGNQFRMRDATIKVEFGAALMAHGATFARDVQLDQSFNTIGAVAFDQCDIKGTLTFADSRIKSAAIARGIADPASARGSAQGVRQSGTSDGPADFDESAISLIDARIGRLRMPARAEQRPRGIVDFSRASVGSFEDFAATWPETRTRAFANGRDIDHLVLDGFTYAHLENPSGAPPDGTALASTNRTGSLRVHWLMGQRAEDVSTTFKPQPWVGLAERLAGQGYDAAAREIAIVQRRKARGARSVSRGERWQNRLLDWFALYGFNPWRTVVWMVFVVLAFAVVWSWAAGYCTEAGCIDETIFIKTANDGYTQTGLARGYPDFHPLAYSLDLFLPFADFGFDSHWRVNIRFGELAVVPVPSSEALMSLLLGGEPKSLIAEVRITIGSILYALAFLERVLGLLLTSLAVTAFTGLLRPRL